MPCDLPRNWSKQRADHTAPVHGRCESAPVGTSLSDGSARSRDTHMRPAERPVGPSSNFRYGSRLC